MLCILCAIAVFKPIRTHALAGTVTGYEKITWGISTGRYYVNNIHAFCAQYNKSWPTVGTAVERMEPCNNEVLRKALYYGYNGPANKLGTDDKAHVLTAIAISDANIGERETGASSKYDEFYWDIVNHPENYPTPPDSFKAYMAITKSEEMQNLAFYEIEKNGYVTAIKISSNPNLTNENNCYSLEGAKYGLYKDTSLSESAKVGTLTMDANGKSNTVELAAGIYYACEIVAPKGYTKSDKVTQFTVTAAETITLTFSDIPHVNPIKILLQKVDADTNSNKPQGAGSLKGALFTVQYYAGVWGENENPEAYGVSPTRTWIFETDEQGIVKYEKDYLISGDALYEAMPLGTLVIRETKASEGYLRNETVFVKQITTSVYQPPIIPEKVITYDLVIRKKDVYDKLLAGAEFTLFSDAECKQEIATGVTDEKGSLRFEKLYAMKRYYLKETKAPTGYCEKVDENGEQLVYEIYERKMPENGEIYIDIVNDKDFVLPNTGTPVPVLMQITGFALCALSLKLNTKKKTKKGEK